MIFSNICVTSHCTWLETYMYFGLLFSRTDNEDLLGDSFLTNPYLSLGLLAALILLVLGGLVGIAVLCVCNSFGIQNKRLSTSSSIGQHPVTLYIHVLQHIGEERF